MRKSMKLIRILLIISLALVLGMTLAAQAEPNRQRITINDITFDVTVVNLKILENGNLALKLAMTGAGIIDCGTNLECDRMDLDGTEAIIAQGFNLQIVIDVIGAGVISGRTVGSFQIGGASTDLWNFRGSVKGEFAPGPDSTHGQFQLLVKAGGKFGAKLNMDLTGVFSKVTGEFENLEGDSFFVPARFPFSS